MRYRAVVAVVPLDVLDRTSHPAFAARVLREVPVIETLVVLAGYLGEPERTAIDPAEAAKILDTNFSGVVSVLTAFVPYFQEQRAGEIAIISSVAGDRGRQSNYVYGAAKAGLTVFAQGLRNRLYPDGVRVLTVKPGFVDTGMTYGMKGLFLVASPERVARSILRALRRRRNVVYVPWFWRWIMALIRAIPEPLFKRLKL